MDRRKRHRRRGRLSHLAHGQCSSLLQADQLLGWSECLCGSGGREVGPEVPLLAHYKPIAHRDPECRRLGRFKRTRRYDAPLSTMGEGKQCALLYFGDHDPGGLHISDFLRANFEELERAVGWSPRYLIIDRFGLDYNFIERNGLTWIENLATGSGKSLADPKHPDHFKAYVQTYLRRFGARKVEANALVARPEAGRELCRQAILRYVPESAIDDYRQ